MINNDRKVGKLTVNLDKSQGEELSIADIKFDAIAGIATRGRVHLAILAFDQQTLVSRGENRGKQLPHDFVVIGYKAQAMQQESNSFTAKLALPNVDKFNAKKKALVVWVSNGSDPSPIQATGDWL